MGYSKANVAANRITGRIGLTFGVAALIFSGILTVALGFPPPFLLADGMAIFLICLSKRLRALARDFDTYAAVLSRCPSGYIPDIAAALGKTEDVVKKELNCLIRNKFFFPAYIDPSFNCIVFAPKPAAPAGKSQPAPPRPAVDLVTVKCKNCGGFTTIHKGQTGICSYCDSPIKGD